MGWCNLRRYGKIEEWFGGMSGEGLVYFFIVNGDFGFLISLGKSMEGVIGEES